MESAKLTYNIDNIFGSTSSCIHHLAQAQACLVYLASSFVVFYSPKLDEQVAYLRHSSCQISSIAVSNDQKYMAIADRNKPSSISVYAINNLQLLKGDQIKPTFILKGHKYSIDLLVFSPNGRYLLSVSNHDGSMFLWEKGQCVTKNRISKTVSRAIFDGNGDLVTVGRGYLKVWKFSGGEVVRKKQQDCWIMEGKVLTFGKTFSSKDFIELVFYRSSTNLTKILLLSSDGMLCIMTSNYQKIQKWIDLVMPRAVGLKVVGNLALCGGDNALIKSVDLDNLTLKNKFPKPPPNNKQNLNDQFQLDYGEDQQFPSCIGILQVNQFIVTLYANRTIFLWQLNDQPCAVRSIISHRSSINSLSLLQQVKGDICFFGSSSSDGTIRLWHFYKKQFSGQKQSIDIARVIGIKRNVYCRNLTRIIYYNSQLPIIQIKLYQKHSIACISSKQFLIYSLDNFQLLLLYTFDEEQTETPNKFLTLQTYEDVIYFGDDSGKLKAYRQQGQTLTKLRQFQLQMPIESMQIFSKRLLLSGKGRLKCMSFEGETIFNQYNVQCSVGFNNNIIYCQKRQAIIYNLTRNKKTGSVSLSHQLDQHQTIKHIRSNSWLILMLTNKNKIIITNFSSVVLYSQEINEAITDFTVNQGGQIIISTQNGTILVRRQQNNRYKQIDSKVKRWFQIKDMSWMDQSVWASSKNKSNSNSNQILLEGIQNQNSIRLGDDSVYKSIGLQPRIVADLAVSYKNQQNKRSIFNPSSICAQANKIYNNVNEIMKNRGGMNSPKNLISDKSKSKRRIFKDKDLDMSEKSQYVPTFTNNLVESVIRDCPPSIITKNQRQVISTEDNDVVTKSKDENNSINFGFIQFEQEKSLSAKNDQFSYTETRNHEGNQQFLKSIDQIMKNSDKIQHNKQYFHTMLLDHYEEYQKLYQILNTQFGRKENEERIKETRKKFQKFAQLFLSQLN